MKDERKTAPVIRFNGFSDDWEQRKLGEVTESFDGKRVPIDSGLRVLGEYPYYGATGIIDYVDDYIFDGEYVLLAEDGANIIMRNNPVAYLTQGKFWLNNHAHIMRIIEGNNYFLVQVLEKIDYIKYNTGTAQPKLNSKIVKNIEFKLPQIEEQQKIGAFFKQLDDTIALHQRKLDALRLMKKALLQLLFPENGYKVPKLRFADFVEEWEQCKLGDLGSVVMNRRIFKEETADKGDIPFYKIGTFGGEADSYITQEKFEDYKLKYPYPETGDILISASGSIGRTVEYNGEEAYYQDSNIVWLKHDKQLYNLFLKQFYFIVKWSGVEGTTIKRLYNKNILETEINIPSINEQKEIGGFFKQLDETIALYQKKLDKLNTLKKAYLQNMFI
ncbi:restriction endonuclease subunit S [Listeria seeligeri]|uniref:restriction endonuclease subunit S n=1 Tax=Listeria seeligeri TaxID=1640 RepID=UPI001889118A|nr:restriction endonuclease subunit S [Listeria seeligeri]MBF2346240.1 restriction endonuclease subunit S [Listeria seeligeri]